MNIDIQVRTAVMGATAQVDAASTITEASDAVARMLEQTVELLGQSIEAFTAAIAVSGRQLRRWTRGLVFATWALVAAMAVQIGVMIWK